jgi:hypothetical protein
LSRCHKGLGKQVWEHNKKKVQEKII